MACLPSRPVVPVTATLNASEEEEMVAIMMMTKKMTNENDDLPFMVLEDAKRRTGR